jgi:L-ribulose-5-phosphate 3-epimerase
MMIRKTVTRRSFLKGAAAAAMGCAAAGAFPGGTVSAQAGKASPGIRNPAFRIGALDSVLSGRGKMTWNRLYRRAGELGFEGMELGAGKDYDRTELWKAEARKRLRDSAEKAGVLTPSICLHAFWNFSFAAEDPANRGRAGRLAREAAFAARDMGARNILIPLTNPDSVEPGLARERWISGLKEAAGTAEECGVAFCVENVEIPFADGPEDIAAVVDAVGSPAVGVYYDPGNAVRSGHDPLAAIPKLGGRIRQIHVKEIRGIYLGEGAVPWPGILEALRGIGYSGWLMLETEATADPKTAAKRNLETMRKLLA